MHLVIGACVLLLDWGFLLFFLYGKFIGVLGVLGLGFGGFA